MNTTREEYAPAGKWKTGIDFILKPYFNRVKLGEGGLVVFNLFQSLFAHRETGIVVFEVAVSFFVMCALYGYNDFSDRHKDGQNEKKDWSFVNAILQNERLFIRTNLLLTLLTLTAALLFLSWSKVLVMLLLYTVNFLYSKRFKSMPVIDIIMVGLWGGLYVMISGSFQWPLIFIVSTMTGIAHLFQIMTDKVSDGENNIKTTMVALPGSGFLFLSALCIALSGLLFMTLNIWWALSGLLPIVIYTVSRRVTLSWHVSRAYFFICWLALLTLFYGSL